MNKLTINGKPRTFPAETMPKTLTELLNQLKVEPATIVAEINGQIIEKANFSSTQIKENQNIELVRFVPGG